MTQRQINEIIRVKFRLKAQKMLGIIPYFCYYNDLYKTGNRRKIFKVYTSQRVNEVKEMWEYVKMWIDPIDPGWEVVVERGYVALVKYEKKQPTKDEFTESYKERVRKSTDILFKITSSIAESIKPLGYNADEVYVAIDTVDIAIKKYLNSL